jgi:DNA-binding transcriptional ArsR family regulator
MPTRELHLVDEPQAAAALASPVRRELLARLVEPGSASTLARELGVPRQRVAYHVKALEQVGLVRLVREEQRRGCTERIVQSTARQYAPAPSIFGRAGLSLRKVRDRFSSSYLVAEAAQVAHEVSAAQAAAAAAGRTLPTLTLSADITFPSPERRTEFAEELMRCVAALASKYHDASAPRGGQHRLFVGAYPLARVPRHLRSEREETA